MNTLTYKTQTEVSAIVRRFWSQYLGSMLGCILLAAGLFYGSFNAGFSFSGTPGFSLAGGLFTAGVMVSFSSYLGFLLSLPGLWSIRTKQVPTSNCEKILQWMASHPEIKQHVEEIRAERAVLLYDYRIMEDWVGAYKEAQKSAQQEAACKLVHGIA